MGNLHVHFLKALCVFAAEPSRLVLLVELDTSERWEEGDHLIKPITKPFSVGFLCGCSPQFKQRIGHYTLCNGKCTVQLKGVNRQLVRIFRQSVLHISFSVPIKVSLHITGVCVRVFFFVFFFWVRENCPAALDDSLI